MNKEQKAAVVKGLTAELSGAEAIFAIDYRGISVPQAAELRTGLREADARFRIVKNRLTLRAADAAGTEDIKEHLSGPTALTLVQGDVALAAKTLSKLGEEWELLEFKGGIMDGAALDKESFLAIAKLPGRDQLNAQFAGVVASPLTGLVRGLGSMVQGLASQLQQIADQALVTGDPPPPAEETPADDSPAEAEDAPADTPDDASKEPESSEDAPADPPDDASKEPESSEGAPDGPAGKAEEPAVDEASEPDPSPEDSPEEERSEEEAPKEEDAGEPVEGAGEGDADIGEETSEDSEETTKENE